ncbi:tRNA (adenosine(37)-N6)-threonylcarbamoyltransferase complex ATPase subunit type 1 TsaE [Fictibacillus enclensis]|uniref:tRNA (adenosine(37)-N6)-threonylcarbamoyltransferase complex ATPase subunit type 1 TsaE n=1 Tax=Fictibacillus enclensis TaxID=1017270 RepID=UPI0024BF84B6|nr:tRNA (adenosine(37)-N6)-threonylcarbamoyltransferase complex ATPase subunit type 1 TsaE [Fictibacillus enclensis]MDM5197006.1 tRNA (adenosine(37)-N6)-threonylcarbamoyltransferase complex ATPase subunit type 1 TsaE [Fictibacillus enclensis]MDM5336132.1 tRNA (adenosine(37)-N6)-threonylcarbamoyltransferase complex ATPase subunit type 1 TsaE [Fictibacillus enclensis]WHY72624.1 tRNA (adenosine(37)-N6)-threonylcarbamoyltransferase complex ATPase subunit type 1 TsaE [Fictibacillus enclensis]
MEQLIISTTSPEETAELAEKLGTLLQAGDVLTLEGDLGAGKTTFTKGLAKGLGVKRVVNSPTFTIIKEYNGRVPFYHMDVYRLEDSDEDLGFEEYFEGEGVTVVEWAQFIADRLPEERLTIDIRRTGDETRELKFTPDGERFIKVCKELEK